MVWLSDEFSEMHSYLQLGFHEVVEVVAAEVETELESPTERVVGGAMNES
eukprot:m.139902 g.139902  ORF g.139902 m.139902 type:complete len:50 (+) comp14028_c0_seq34:284-433(+)